MWSVNLVQETWFLLFPVFKPVLMDSLALIWVAQGQYQVKSWCWLRSWQSPARPTSVASQTPAWKPQVESSSSNSSLPVSETQKACYFLSLLLGLASVITTWELIRNASPPLACWIRTRILKDAQLFLCKLVFKVEKPHYKGHFTFWKAFQHFLINVSSTCWNLFSGNIHVVVYIIIVA